ncbi:MAG TPA: class I SAM-dependent methyltransferase [Candidatus Paceibacterota bacterium]|nr:class I SAM-dependent methyltransferase [Candidatus Paceibacterota bacterium]
MNDSTARDRYGVDVAAKRLDDLDTQLLAAVTADVARGQQPTVLDLGCGSGALAEQLATAGARVTAVDTTDYHADIAARNASMPATAVPIDFRLADVLTFCQQNTSLYGSVGCQRMLHYLSYLEAIELLRSLRQCTQRLFISVTGAESDIGQHHPRLQAPLFERFARLPPPVREQFSLAAPLCVYTYDEFCALLNETGWQIETSWTSLFGNHKVIASV